MLHFSFQSDIDTSFLSAFLTFVIFFDLTLYLKSYHSDDNVFIISVTLFSVLHYLYCL